MRRKAPVLTFGITVAMHEKGLSYTDISIITGLSFGDVWQICASHRIRKNKAAAIPAAKEENHEN